MTDLTPDPTTLAREVLERKERLSAYSYSIPLEAQASWDATRSEQVKAAPDLARAVIELTAERDELAAAIACLAKTRETLPCGCETPLNAVHILDH